jgi:hypothetical protein
MWIESAILSGGSERTEPAATAPSDFSFADLLTASLRFSFATVARADECLLESALDAVLQAASVIAEAAAVACSGSHGRRIGTIAFDGDHVCGAGSSECCAETKAITVHTARSVAFDQDLALQDRTDRALRRTME